MLNPLKNPLGWYIPFYFLYCIFVECFFVNEKINFAFVDELLTNCDPSSSAS
jgi:hypothetical protein